MHRAFVCLCLLVAASAAGTWVVTDLDLDVFRGSVLESEMFWLVLFTTNAKWCKECAVAKKTFQEASVVLRGVAKAGRVDADAHAELCSAFGVTDFPAVLLFGVDKDDPLHVPPDAGSVKSLVQFTLNQIRAVLRQRLGLSPPAHPNAAAQDDDTDHTQDSESADAAAEVASSSAVVRLKASTFDDEVIASNTTWLIEFFAPWCQHCQALAPALTAAAQRVQDRLGDSTVRFGSVDCTVEEDLAQRYDVVAYPTIKLFLYTNNERKDPVEYEGRRGADDLFDFAVSLASSFTPPDSDRTNGDRTEPPEPAKEEPAADKGAPDGTVVELSTANFDTVLASDTPWMVEFFAPWCGHCQALAPAWKEAAGRLAGKVWLGTVDCTVHRDLASKYGIQGFPTIKVFKPGASAPTEYPGGRSAESIVGFGYRLLGEEPPEGPADPSTDVVKLTSTNFQRKVLDSTDLWLVEFFAPWCGHCQQLEPAWKDAAYQLKGKVRLGAVDCTVQTELADKFGVSSYPTIKVFPAGSKIGADVQDYAGGRSADAIVSTALDLYSSSADPPPVEQITSHEVFRERCLATRHLCVVVFLPHILDTGAAGRTTYLQLVGNAARQFVRHPVNYVWAEAAQQPELEDALGAGGAGYPAVVVMSHRKKKLVPFVGALSEEALVDFLRRVLSGKERPMGLPLLPKVRSTLAWDVAESSDESSVVHDEL